MVQEPNFSQGSFKNEGYQVCSVVTSLPFTSVVPGSNPTSDQSLACGLGFQSLPDCAGFPPFGVFLSHILNFTFFLGSYNHHLVILALVLLGLQCNKNIILTLQVCNIQFVSQTYQLNFLTCSNCHLTHALVLIFRGVVCQMLKHAIIK